MSKQIITSLIFLTFLFGAGLGGLWYWTSQNLQALEANMTFAAQTFTEALEQQQEALIDAQQQTLSYIDQKESAIRSDITAQVGGLQSTVDQLQSSTQASLSQLGAEVQQVESDSLSRLQEFESRISSLQVQSEDFSSILQYVMNGVVGVRSDKGLGSGAIIDERGFIVTNYHVVQGSSGISINTFNEQTYAARLIAYNSTKDLALLQIQQGGRFDYLRILPVVQTGEKVIAVGSPGGLDFTVTEGIVSSAERTGSSGTKYVQTDVPINPGNSGGPLVNTLGKIVGINTMKIKGFEGVGFAIHPQEVQMFVNQNLP